MSYFDSAVKKSKAYYCLDCGKCTASCPISQFDENFSPRRIIDQVILQDPHKITENGSIWKCLTCQMCNERCPSDVLFAQFITDIRKEAFKEGHLPQCSHGGILHTVMQMMARPNLKQNRTGWITKKLKTAEESDYLYFVGCLPYYNDIFNVDIEVKPLEIAQSTVKILNHLGIEPIVLDNERCCGIDLLSMGNEESFKELAQLNIDMIMESGATKVVTACAECYHTLKNIYPTISPKFKPEILHISQVINNRLGDFSFKKKQDTKITYQDPCKLGRFSRVYDEPRNALTAIPGVELKEMVKSRHNAMCCGTSSWINCDTVSKRLQVQRLTQAVNSGGEILITSCPKCHIHFNCALHGENIDKGAKINVQDLTVFVASSLSSGAKK